MISSLQWLCEAGGRSLGIRFEQTKQGFVWLVTNSVHTPLGKRLLQLTLNTFQLAGWLYNVSLINYRLHILLQFEHHLWSIFENRINRTFYRVAFREAIASKKVSWLRTLKLNYKNLRRLYEMLSVHVLTNKF